MADIEMRSDPFRGDLWWIYWTERDEIVGRIDQDLGGRCVVTPQGSALESDEKYRSLI